jgi:hypothetical protein
LDISLIRRTPTITISENFSQSKSQGHGSSYASHSRSP